MLTLSNRPGYVRFSTTAVLGSISGGRPVATRPHARIPSLCTPSCHRALRRIEAAEHPASPFAAQHETHKPTIHRYQVRGAQARRTRGSARGTAAWGRAGPGRTGAVVPSSSRRTAPPSQRLPALSGAGTGRRTLVRWGFTGGTRRPRRGAQQAPCLAAWGRWARRLPALTLNRRCRTVNRESDVPASAGPHLGYGPAQRLTVGTRAPRATALGRPGSTPTSGRPSPRSRCRRSAWSFSLPGHPGRRGFGPARRTTVPGRVSTLRPVRRRDRTERFRVAADDGRAPRGGRRSVRFRPPRVRQVTHGPG